MRLLVAVDSSPTALRAVRFAAALLGAMKTRTCTMALISVHDDAGLRHAASVVGHDAVDDYLRDLSAAELEPATRWLAEAGIAHEVIVRTGHVAQCIVEAAASRSVDLIVLGAKGRGAIADLLIGSVAQRVLATAAMPVTLVK